jgi:pimeloyl-ACP methyl ester carboxylesterase
VTVRTYQSSDGVRLVYDDLGPRDGLPVVLCHGLAAQAAQFADDAAFFAGLGHRVLVPDLRGCGRSASPSPMTVTAFRIEQLADDLTRMLDDAQAGPVHWLGNSLGGIAALAMLPLGRFRTLATFGTAYSLDLPQVGGHRLISASYAVLGMRTMAAITARTTTSDKAARALIERMLNDSRPEVTSLQAGAVTRYDLIANAVAAPLPILMLRGGRDTLVNAALPATLAVMQGRPNFTLVELPAGGHCANLDARDAFRAALLKFWSAAGR